MRDVTAAVIYQNGRVLVARRKAGGDLSGKWEFPGGKIEPGETPETALRRELQEELNLEEARIGPFIGSSRFQKNGASYRLLAYRVFAESETLQLLEHEEIRWVVPGQLKNYDMPDSDRALLPQIRATLP
jgi:8-oxo-dGTP diphosphatase